MDEELVLLTSYFNLAKGRRQDTADTFRIDPEVPSATSPDGTAALYVLTEASASGNMGPRARRLAADTVAWEYQTHADEAPATRIRSALRSAHEAVRKEFDGHVAVGTSVIAVEEDIIYLGQVAPAQVYVLHDGSLHSLPASAGSSAPFSQALGSSTSPRIQVFKDQVGSRDVVALCSSWFRRALDTEDLRECFAADTADEIIESLLRLAKAHDADDATAVVIEAVPASELEGSSQGEGPGLMEQVDAAVQALAGIGKMLWSELRAVPRRTRSNGSGTRPEPRRNLGGSKEVPEIESVQTPPTGVHHQMTEEVPIVSEAIAETPDSVEYLDIAPEESGEEIDDWIPMASGRDLPNDQRHPQSPAAGSDVEPAGKQESQQPREPLSEIDQVNSRLREGSDMGDVIPPVQAFPDTSTTQPERIYATSKDIQAVNKRPRRLGGVVRPAAREPLSGPSVLRPNLGSVDLRRPSSSAAPPSMVWLGIAVVFILAAGALFLFLRHHHAVAVNPYPALVRQDIRRAGAAKKAVNQDYYLRRAHQHLTLAAESGAGSTTVSRLRRQLRIMGNRLHHVTRIFNPVVLANFTGSAGAQPSQIATAPGLVYVLDSGRKKVFSYATTAGSGPTSIVVSGEQDSNFTIGSPLQLATAGSTALVLDDHNTLLRYANDIKTATSLTQPDQNERIIAMATEDPDVYLLDPAHNQVWRYPFAVSSFNPAAQSYFPGTPPYLSAAIAFTMDGVDLYVLQRNGHVLKFDNGANARPFSSNLRTPLRSPIAISTAPNLKDIWIADPTTGRIVQLDKAGTYLRTYMSGTSGLDLHTLKSMAIGPSGNTLYVLTGTKLVDFSVTQ